MKLEELSILASIAGGTVSRMIRDIEMGTSIFSPIMLSCLLVIFNVMMTGR